MPESPFKGGQVWRSKELRDYSVKLIRPLENGFWIVEPSGMSAHGSYTVNESRLSRSDLYELVTDA